MTVKELKEALEGYDDDLEVVIKTELFDDVPVEYLHQTAFGEVELS
ncbi:MAG: hypothetical protein LBL04_14040 [Bacteroidales bacterium]|jgi:hypothetical protein|nr:hypothetical protein [Bacteroidales bacterium]